MSNLWSLIFDTDNTLPILVRGNQSGDFSYHSSNGIYGKLNRGGPYDAINVVTDFPWTKSPKTSRYDVPRLQLVEKRLLVNSTTSNFIYSALAGGDVVASTAARIKNDLPINVGGAEFKLFEAAEKIPGASSILNKIKDKAGGFEDSVDGIINSAKNAVNINRFNQSVLEPYEGLYITEDTGFQYILPYFDDDYNDFTTSYGEDSSILGSLNNKAADLIDFAASIAAVDKPGVYIEGSKQFTMKDSGRTINIKFPLLNTGDFNDITRNWQLIYGLVYQNRPGRINRSLIDVPVIYEAYIEGVAYMPYAHISRMSVSFHGSRRRMKIKIPSFKIPQNGDGSDTLAVKNEVTMTIPDAYMVDIQITGMNDESRNFLFRSLGNTIITSKDTSREMTLNPNVDVITDSDDIVPKRTPNANSNK